MDPAAKDGNVGNLGAWCSDLRRLPDQFDSWALVEQSFRYTVGKQTVLFLGSVLLLGDKQLDWDVLTPRDGEI